MPVEQPGAGDSHVNQLLTNVSVGYKNEEYIVDQIFPEVLVEKRSDIVPEYGKSAWARDEAKELGEREAAPVGGYTTDVTKTYYCKEKGFGHFISDARRKNTDRPFDADIDGTEFVTDKLALNRERTFVAGFWKTGVWGTDASITKWSTYATSTPIQDIRTAARAIRRALMGKKANTLVLGDLVYDVLCDHPSILDRIKYSSSSSQPAMATPALMAQLFGVERVLVGTSMYTASPEGTAEASVTYVSNFDDDALLLYVANRPSLWTPTAGYTFTWRTAMGGPRLIKKRRDPMTDKGDLIEGYQYFDMHQIAKEAGVFFSDAAD